MPQGESPTKAPKERKRAARLLKSLERYGVNRWGEGFVHINQAGNLVFRAPNLPDVDLHEVAELLEQRGIHAPFVLRFPTMIDAQMERLRRAFDGAAAEHGFDGGHVGVFPLKCNQRRAVLDTVVQARESQGFGLEAGSKPELLLAMAQPVLEGSPLVCNGYKDLDFIRMAFHAAELGHEVILVLESVREVGRFINVAGQMPWKASPRLGLRAKLYSRGSGRWQTSGGWRSKFGLTTGEILEVVRRLEDAEMLELLCMLHFHIGSQITQIKRVKTAIREGMRIWSFLRRQCPGLRYLDLGGGIGVDYDGSHTSDQSSANYTIEEYASQIVFEVAEMASDMEVPHPTIITESGRILVASHAVVIADLREVQGELLPVPEAREDENRLIEELRDTLENINVKNLEEYFHDALDYRDEALHLFSSGYLTLEERASAESLFHRIRLAAVQLVSQMRRQPEEIVDYLHSAHHKYLANFSIFQSIPDAWSIDQVFPAAPLSRHGEEPNINAQIVDITCDSDGCVDTFAHPEENLRSLPLHAREDSDDAYYLGFFLTGAYQDSLANVHNLFSRCHEVIVRAKEEDRVIHASEWIDLDEDHGFEINAGLTSEDALAWMGFDVDSLNLLLRARHLERETTLGAPWAQGLLQAYPYLSK